MVNGLIVYTHVKNLDWIDLTNFLIMIEINDMGLGCNKVILKPNSFVV